MRIRLHGTRDECHQAAELLTELFDVTDISRLYPDRPPSPLYRCYVTTAPAADTRDNEGTQ